MNHEHHKIGISLNAARKAENPGRINILAIWNGQTDTKRVRENEQSKRRRGKTESLRKLRYARLEFFEIRLGIFVGNY